MIALEKRTVDRYFGDRKEQRRHGFGVYVYDNKFFKYQGQWENGSKHGHGRLTMNDGGFYEGTFVKGEIEGHGYRFYGHSGNSYTGQFLEGERHGQGVLKMAEGSQYEGTWVHGKMEGSGMLTEPDGSVYEGEFHNNKRHGEGIQMYSSTVYYEGGWIDGKRHGQGIFRSEDGSVYNGQWRGDVYHGEGTMEHSSGVTYTGMWVNGRPGVEPVSMKYIDSLGNSELIVEQGKTFELQLSCVDASGKVVTFESGRSLLIQANTLKSNSTKKRSQLTRAPTSQNIPEALFPYELLQVPQNSAPPPSHPSDTIPERAKTDLPPSTAKSIPIAKETVESDTSNKLVNSSDDLMHTSSMILLQASPTLSSKVSKLETPLSNAETKSLSSITKRSMDTQEDEFLSSLVLPSKVLVKDGIAVFKDLFLPPPPIALNSLISTTSPSKDQPLSPTNSTDSSIATSKKQKMTPSFPQPSSVTSRTPKTTAAGRTTSRLSEREKLLQPKRENFCIPGTYILRIFDVTDPPFMGSKLPDLFIQVKVVPQKASSPASFEKLISSKTASRVIPKPINDNTK